MIFLNIDVSKITKERIAERSYTNKDNKQVIVKELKLALIPLRQPKVIKKGNGWDLKKTHMIVEAATKEERQAGTKTEIVGEGIQFVTPDGMEANPQDDTPF